MYSKIESGKIVYAEAFRARPLEERRALAYIYAIHPELFGDRSCQLFYTDEDIAGDADAAKWLASCIVKESSGVSSAHVLSFGIVGSVTGFLLPKPQKHLSAQLFFRDVLICAW